MKKPQKKKVKDGKFLEMLVECLQKLFAEDGITVKRGQKYYSKSGKQVGEVDVVIEGIYKSKFIKIGTECRDRKGSQGVDWIQQIIGRKFHLAEFGFTNWIAVSTSGFNKEATQLAKRADIRLLIPGEAVPVEEDKHKHGPHIWMKLPRVNYPHFMPLTMEASIYCDTDEMNDEILNELIRTEALNSRTQIVVNDTESLYIHEFIEPHVKTYLENLRPEVFKNDFKKFNVFEFENLEGVIDGMHFKFSKIKIKVQIDYEYIQHDFKTMVLAISDPVEVLGLIGINEYKSKSENSYIMIAVKAGEPYKAVALIRDSKGNTMPNKRLDFLIPQYRDDGEPIINVPVKFM